MYFVLVSVIMNNSFDYFVLVCLILSAIDISTLISMIANNILNRLCFDFDALEYNRYTCVLVQFKVNDSWQGVSLGRNHHLKPKKVSANLCTRTLWWTNVG